VLAELEFGWRWLGEVMAGSTDPTFVFADLSGFTALTEAHGDEEAADIVAPTSSEPLRRCSPRTTRRW